MSTDDFTTRVVQFIDNPEQSNALAEIKRISNQAKNKSSRNLTYINKANYELDIDTKINTEMNKNMFKENNDKNTFQRRKHQFATQIYEPNIANMVKRKANLKKWKGLFDNDEDKKEENSNKKKNKKKHVDFTLNHPNKTKKKEELINDYNNIINNKSIKAKDDSDMNNSFKKRKTSSNEKNIETSRIIRYFENPKDSNALAEIKRISDQAKKNKTSKNLIYINRDEMIISPEDENKNNKPSKLFNRRKFQFATMVYVPKKNNLTLMEEINKYKNGKISNEEKDSDKIGSEEDESEDSIFNLEKLEKDDKNEKDINPINKEDINDKLIKEEKPEENTPSIELRNNINKGRNLLMEQYKKLEPRKEREKYSFNTINISEINKYKTSKKEYTPRNAPYEYDTLIEEYKKRNNLTVENINTKEKIIKNEYRNKNKAKKLLKTYKTEYFWDKTINRLVEKRIYLDDNESNKTVNNDKYNNNSFNPFTKYKNNFDTRENENNVTQKKIELDSDNKNPKEKEAEKENNTNIVKENDNKKYVYSRKYKYLPHLYTANTFKVVKNVNNNNITENIKKESNNTNSKITASKSNYRVYQKRQIIHPNEELKENKPKEKIETNKYVKRPPKKEKEERKKKIFSKKSSNPHSISISETNKKNDEVKFKKVIPPYSSNNNNSKNKNIRLNMFSGENDIFKESQEDLKDKNKNNIYSNYIRNKKTTIAYNRSNRTNNDSEFIEDLEKIEQYSINTYLKNDLLEIYGSINEEFKDFKNDVFNNNLNDFENKMGEFDKDKDEFIRKNKKFNVKDLCKGKTTTDDIYRKYKRRGRIIKYDRNTYNN